MKNLVEVKLPDDFEFGRFSSLLKDVEYIRRNVLELESEESLFGIFKPNFVEIRLVELVKTDSGIFGKYLIPRYFEISDNLIFTKYGNCFKTQKCGD